MLNREEIIKQNRIMELAEDVSNSTDLVKLTEYVDDTYGDLDFSKLKSKKTKSFFTELPDYKFNDMKNVIKDLGLKIKIINLGPTFPKKPMWNMTLQNKYDIMLEGNPTDLWPMNIIFNGMWLEEFLAFIEDESDPILDKKFKGKSWHVDKYIDPDLKAKVRELNTLTGAARISLPIVPLEMAVLKAKDLNFSNIAQFKIEIFKSVTIGKELEDSLRSLTSKKDFYSFLYFVVDAIGTQQEPLTRNTDGYFIAGKEIRVVYKLFSEMTSKINKEFNSMKNIGSSGLLIKWFNIFFSLENDSPKTTRDHRMQKMFQELFGNLPKGFPKEDKNEENKGDGNESN